MKLKSPQAKGKGFEREIAKELSKKFDTVVIRTPCSGGIHVLNTADLTVKDRESVLFQFHFELKKRKNLSVMKTYDDTQLKTPANKTLVIVWTKNFRQDPLTILGFYDFTNLLLHIKNLENEIRRLEN